jgi:hypothetical protein
VALPSTISIAPAVFSRRIRFSVQPRACIAGSISLAHVSASPQHSSPTAIVCRKEI